ncbi:VOC family protein [Aliiglaciecola sp. LCG003]|uniref:VOC family protein n=1 Tax=Aliiglaciecola sp. LCG003 TaxID=3053655 RepID=UPI0025738F2A|nr:VOC family protein [Aliiglaciecola sp. LCG003]WJG11117.1 VOC family protein [Aliiglaciecola sp. LCG003]
MTIQINYIEIPVKDIQKSRVFFNQVFGWTFVEYGEEYLAIENAGVAGGLYLADTTVATASGSVLVVMYTDKLEQLGETIEQNGGTITKPIFSFPGGRRFHFVDLNNNEYAVWSDK